MSEQLMIDQLDQVVDAVIARREPAVSSQQELAELSSLAIELRELPREGFKSNLRETLKRSVIMPTTGTSTGTETQSSSQPAHYHTVTPYLTVKRAEQLVDFVKTAFEGVEVFRTTGSAGGMHAEVTIGDS